jgi:hypothetical protein
MEINDHKCVTRGWGGGVVPSSTPSKAEKLGHKNAIQKLKNSRPLDLFTTPCTPSKVFLK